MTAAGGSYLSGVLYKVLYVLTVVVMLALIKGAKGVPLAEIIFFRCIFAIIPIAIWLWVQGETAGAFRTARPWAHVTRTALGMSCLTLTYVAVTYLPLPETVTLQYSTPLFVVAFSAMFLAERVGVYRWGAVVFGFLGVLVITWPNLTLLTSGAAGLSDGEVIGVAAALIASAGVAVVLLLVGELVKTEKPTTISLYFWLISSLITAVAATLTGWVAVSVTQAILLAICGILGGLAQMFMAQSVKAAPASSTASFEYLSIIFATGVGYVFFGNVPGLNTLFGGLMVIAAGLTILWREQKRGVAARRPPKVVPPE